MPNYSPNKGFAVPVIGGDANIWGNPAGSYPGLNETINALDAALGQTVNVNCAGSANITLTSGQYGALILNLTGALTANISVILPQAASVSNSGWYVVRNNTTGAYTINVVTAYSGSTGPNIPQGSTSLIYSDAQNVRLSGSSLNQMISLTAAGTSEMLTATISPSITLVDGLIIEVTAAYANTTVAPKFNGLTITRWGGQPLVPGCIYGAGHRLLLCYSASALHWELINPRIPLAYSVGSSANALVQLTAAAKIPAVDGSQLTNLPFGWQTITANQSGVTKTGYVCNSASQLTVTTPASASIGDQFAVAAYGAGGFLLSPQAGQTIQYGATAVNSSAGLSGAQGAVVRLVYAASNLWIVAAGVLSSAGTTQDPFWNDVTFYMPLSTLAIPSSDASANGIAVTNNGSIAGSTTHTQYGAYAAYLGGGGSGQYLSIPANNAFKFSGSMTLEGWFFFPNFTAAGALFDTRSASGSTTGLLLQATASTGLLTLKVNNAVLITSSFAPSLGVWNHIAVTCNSLTGTNGGWTIWINGLSAGTGSLSINLSDGLLNIGAAANLTNYLNAYVTQVRVTNGICRYSGPFTPPLNAFYTTADINFDPQWYRTAFRPIAAATPASSYDASGNGLSLSINSTTTSSSSKQDAYAFVFNGSSNYIGSAAANTVLSGDFTVEAWINMSSISGTATTRILSSAASATGAFYWSVGIYNNSGNPEIDFFDGSDYYSSAGAITSAGVWYHIAVVRFGTTLAFFVNGSRIGTATYTGTPGASNGIFMLGARANGSATIEYWNGSIAGARFTNGARYVSNFNTGIAPLTAPFPVALPTTYDPWWQDVTFMPRAASVMANSVDVSGAALTLLNTGSVTSSATSRQDTYAFVFNGANYLSVASSANAYAFYGDFTIELWVYPTAAGGGSGSCLIGTQTAGGVYIELSASYTVDLSNYGSSHYATTAALTPNQWSHIAFVRCGSVITSYVNGGSPVSSTFTSVFPAAGTLFVGGTGSAGQYFTGSLAGIRVTKAARYVPKFSYPTTPFLTNGAT